MPIKTEAIEQRFLRTRPLTHHRADPPETSESDYRQRGKREFFNRILAGTADCKALVARAVAEFGSIDVLVNTAGVVESRPLLDIGPADFERMIDVYLKGAIQLAHWPCSVTPTIAAMLSVTGHNPALRLQNFSVEAVLSERIVSCV